MSKQSLAVKQMTRLRALFRQGSSLTSLGTVFALALWSERTRAEQDLALELDTQTLQALQDELQERHAELAEQLFELNSGDPAKPVSDADLLAQLEALEASGYLSREEAARLQAVLRSVSVDLGAVPDAVTMDAAESSADGWWQADNSAAPAAEAPPAAAAIPADASSIGLWPVLAIGAAGLAISVGSKDDADSTPPVAPTLALEADTGSSATDGVTSNARINVSGLEAGATWQYSTNGGTSWTTGTGSSFTLAAGSYAAGAIQVRQTDAAGNVSAVGSRATALTVDTAAAAPTLALSGDNGLSATDGITNNGLMSVAGLETGATWQYSTNGGTSWTTGTGSSFTLPAGSYAASAIQVRQTDVAGNVSALASNAAAVQVDTTAPQLVSMSSTGNSNAIGLTYDSALDSAHPPGAGQYVVTINGVAVAISAVAVAGAEVTLTLARNVVAGDTVSVRYTDPSAADDTSAATQDIAGNDAASVTSGKAADGYVRGAQVYVDNNGNGRPDANEALAGVVTDAQGNFFLPSGLAGAIIIKGGVNIDTGAPNLMVLKAPAGSSMVSPLTTLLQTYLESNPTVSVAAANTLVLTALGLPPTLNLASFDPLAILAANPSDPAALAVQKIAAQVATLVTLASNSPSSGTSSDAAASSVIGNLVSAIVASSGTGGSTVDLTSTATLTSVLGSSTTVSVADVQEVTSAIAEATSLDDVTEAQAEATDNALPAKPELLLMASGTGAASAKVLFDTSALDGSAAVVGDTVKLMLNGVAITHELTAADIKAGYVIFDALRWQSGNALTATLVDIAGNASAASSTLTVSALTLLNRTDVSSLTLDSSQTFNFTAADYLTNAAVLNKISNPSTDYIVNVTGVSGSNALEIASHALVDQVTLLADQSFSLSLQQFDAAFDAFAKFTNPATEYSVTLDLPPLTTAADIFDRNGDSDLIDVLNLADNTLQLTDAQASELVDAGLQFAADDTGVQVAHASGTHLQTSLSDLQKLGVDVISIAGSAGTVSIAAGDGELDMGQLPDILAQSGVVLALEIPDDGLSGDTPESLKADAAALHAAGFDVLKAEDGSLSVDASLVKAVHEGGLSFAKGDEITMKIGASGEAEVISNLTGNIANGSYPQDLDILDVVDNTISITDAQASALVDAGLHFAANDTGVTVTHASGTQLKTSLSDLQKLGVDTVAIAATTGSVAIAVGDEEIDMSLLPTITASSGVMVSLEIPDDALLGSTDTELKADAMALHAAGFDALQAADGSLSVDASLVKAIHEGGLVFDDASEITMQIRTAAEASVISTLSTNIGNGSYPQDLDILDVVDNGITITDAQASALVDAGLHFAADDTAVAVQVNGTQMQTSLSDLQKLGVDFVHTATGSDEIYVDLGAGTLSSHIFPVFDAEDQVHLAVEDAQLDEIEALILADDGNDAQIDGLVVVLDDALGLGAELTGQGLLNPALTGDGGFAGIGLSVANTSLPEITLGMILDAVDGDADPLKLLTGDDLVSALQAAGITDIYIEDQVNFSVSDSDLLALTDAGILSASADAEVTVISGDTSAEVTLAQLADMGADHVTVAGGALELEAGVSFSDMAGLQSALQGLLGAFDNGSGTVKPIFATTDNVELHVAGNLAGQKLDSALFAELKLLGIDDVLDDQGQSLKPPAP